MADNTRTRGRSPSGILDPIKRVAQSMSMQLDSTHFLLLIKDQGANFNSMGRPMRNHMKDTVGREAAPSRIG